MRRLFRRDLLSVCIEFMLKLLAGILPVDYGFIGLSELHYWVIFEFRVEQLYELRRWVVSKRCRIVKLRELLVGDVFNRCWFVVIIELLELWTRDIRKFNGECLH
jgi:hypothetical protein